MHHLIPSRRLVFSLSAAVLIGTAIACTEPTTRSAARAPADAGYDKTASTDVHVSTADALYDAVSDPSNAGHRIVLDPGAPYMLDAGRPNPRLELQQDMELVGGGKRPGDVVIDASALTAASFTTPQGLTGAIRMGRGANAVRNLTVRNAASGAAAIEADLVSTGPATIVIASVVVTGNQRGIDIRNQGAAAAGRVLTVELTDNEMTGNIIGQGQGMRLVNTGANGAAIHVSMKGNNSHGNVAGCLVANLNASDALVTMDSHGDHFSDNANGCILLGGNSSGAARADRNVIELTTQASWFEDNTAPAAMPGGIVAIGGTSVQAGKTSDNTVRLTTHGTKFRDNAGADIAAWGAQTTALQPAGTNNIVYISVAGMPVTITQTPSAPAEPAGTNKVVVTP